MVADAIAGAIHALIALSHDALTQKEVTFLRRTNKEVNKNGVLNCIGGLIDHGIVRFAY